MFIIGLFVIGYIKASNHQEPVRSVFTKEYERAIQKITPTDEEMARAAGYTSTEAYFAARRIRPASADIIDQQE